MNVEHKKILDDRLDKIEMHSMQIHLFQTEVKFQALLSQIQFFQTLCTIILAVIALIFGVKEFAGDYNTSLNIWFYLAVIPCLICLIYVSSLVREVTDRVDRQVREGEQIIDADFEEQRSKITEAITTDDFSKWTKYIHKKNEDSKKKNTSEQLFYTGEIVIFLFNVCIFSSIIYISNIWHKLDIIGNAGMILVVIISSLILIQEWSLGTTGKISLLVEKIKKICSTLLS